jgi:hypothetical protein
MAAGSCTKRFTVVGHSDITRSSIAERLQVDVLEADDLLGNQLHATISKCCPVMQTNGVTSFTWTAPPGVTLLSELLIVAGEMI